MKTVHVRLQSGNLFVEGHDPYRYDIYLIAPEGEVYEIRQGTVAYVCIQIKEERNQQLLEYVKIGAIYGDGTDIRITSDQSCYAGFLVGEKIQVEPVATIYNVRIVD